MIKAKGEQLHEVATVHLRKEDDGTSENNFPQTLWMIYTT